MCVARVRRLRKQLTEQIRDALCARSNITDKKHVATRTLAKEDDVRAHGAEDSNMRCNGACWNSTKQLAERTFSSSGTSSSVCALTFASLSTSRVVELDGGVVVGERR